MDLEQVWYEAFPYVYGAGGAVALLFQPGSFLLKVSGGLLIVAAVTILRLRWVYRRAAFDRMPTAASMQSQALDED